MRIYLAILFTALTLPALADEKPDPFLDAMRGFQRCVEETTPKYSSLQSPILEVVEVIMAACDSARMDAFNAIDRTDQDITAIDLDTYRRVIEKARADTIVAIADQRLAH